MQLHRSGIVVVTEDKVGVAYSEFASAVLSNSASNRIRWPPDDYIITEHNYEIFNMEDTIAHVSL